MSAILHKCLSTIAVGLGHKIYTFHLKQQNNRLCKVMHFASARNQRSPDLLVHISTATRQVWTHLTPADVKHIYM